MRTSAEDVLRRLASSGCGVWDADPTICHAEELPRDLCVSVPVTRHGASCIHVGVFQQF